MRLQRIVLKVFTYIISGSLSRDMYNYKSVEFKRLVAVVNSFEGFVIVLWAKFVFLLKEVSAIFHLNVEMLSTTFCIVLNVSKQKYPFCRPGYISLSRQYKVFLCSSHEALDFLTLRHLMKVNGQPHSPAA